MWTGQRVLVTGAGGFIGSHVTEALIRAGASVTALVRYNSNSTNGNLGFVEPRILHSVHIVRGNIEDSEFMLGITQGQDIVLHLAALIAIPYSYEAPRSYVRTNVEGTLNVLEGVRRNGVGRMVHTSTSEVYGTALRVPIDETHPLQGQSPYSATKIGADKLAESYFRSFGTPVVTLRPFNTFGPRQSARAFIPTVITQALQDSQIRLGSLTPERDMTFVSDTVAGFLAAAITPGVEGLTINLGTRKSHSIGWFATQILDLMGVDKPIIQEAHRMRPERSEVGRLVSDNGLAQSRLRWSPRIDIGEGLRRTIEFFRANPDVAQGSGYVV